MDEYRDPRKPPATFPFELKVGTVVRVPGDHEGTIRPGPKTTFWYGVEGEGDPEEVKQQFKAAENKYTVELVADGSIVTVAPGDIKVPVPITGLQLSGWDDVNDTAGVAQQMLKATGSPQRLLIVADAGHSFLPARSPANAAPFKYTFSQTEPAP